MTYASNRLAVGLALILLGVCAAPARGQDLFVGYQFQRFSAEGDGLNVPFGLHGSIAGPNSGPLSFVGQVDWSRKRESETVFGTSFETTVNFTAFAGGVRWTSRSNGSATPFVEALVGAMRLSGSANVAGERIDGGSETNPLLQLGAGATVPMSGPIGAFGQIDYRRIFAEEGVNGVRFVVGIRVGTRR